MPASVKALPNKGCAGSVTVTSPSHSCVTSGVLRWAGFPGAGVADQDDRLTLLDILASHQLADQDAVD